MGVTYHDSGPAGGSLFGHSCQSLLVRPGENALVVPEKAVGIVSDSVCWVAVDYIPCPGVAQDSFEVASDESHALLEDRGGPR